MRTLHIAAGCVSLLAGAIALISTKGSTLHRRSGMLFVAAMLVMSTSAAYIAILLKPNRLNVVAALLTFYLVCTAQLVLRRTVQQARWTSLGFMFMALATTTFAFALGFAAAGSVDGKLDGMPALPFFVFGTLGLMASIGDIRVLRAGSVVGAQRLARHLWRMTSAMLIATVSFFLGQAKFLPVALRDSGMHFVPIAVVLMILFYWLLRLKRRANRGRTIPGRLEGRRNT